MVVRNLLVLTFLWLSRAQAIQIEVSGKVTDFFTHAPIGSASVSVFGVRATTQTAPDGSYLLVGNYTYPYDPYDSYSVTAEDKPFYSYYTSRFNGRRIIRTVKERRGKKVITRKISVILVRNANIGLFGTGISQDMDVNRNYIRRLYTQVLGRNASDGDVEYWLGKMIEWQSRHAVTSSIVQSGEARTNFIRETFALFYNRPPSDTELQTELSFLNSPEGTLETFLLRQVSMGPYLFLYNRNDEWVTHDSFIASLFRHLLKREPRPEEVGPLTNPPLGLLPPDLFATNFVREYDPTSREFYTNYVQAYYRRYLNRAPSFDELESAIDSLRTGLRSHFSDGMSLEGFQVYLLER